MYINFNLPLKKIVTLNHYYINKSSIVNLRLNHGVPCNQDHLDKRKTYTMLWYTFFSTLILNNSLWHKVNSFVLYVNTFSEGLGGVTKPAHSRNIIKGEKTKRQQWTNWLSTKIIFVVILNASLDVILKWTFVGI